VPPLVAPPGGLLDAPVGLLAFGPPNGDFAAGLEGWDVQGREAPALLGPGARIPGNTSLVSPPLLIPPGSQTLRIASRSGAPPGLVVVSARPVEGGPDIELGAIEPARKRSTAVVGVGAVAGRTVRIVLDPVPSLGTTVDILRVGPVLSVLPGWTVERGAPEPTVVGHRPALRVSGDPLEIASPSFRPPPLARQMLVAVRGAGVVSIRAGARRAVLRASSRWRDVTVPLRRRDGGRVVLDITATPDLRPLQLRDLGVVRTAVVARDVREGRSGGRRVVRALLGRNGAGLRVDVLGAGARRVGTARADRRGRVLVRVSPAARGRLTLAVRPDRTRIGLRARVPSPGGAPRTPA
jgi:hypothetical protein